MEVPLETLKSIAEDIQMGMSCYVHKTTKEVISIPDQVGLIGEEFNDAFSDEFEAWSTEIKLVQSSPDSYIAVEKMPSFESYKIMEDFIDTVSDPRLQDRLLSSIQKRKPFQNFNVEIDNSGLERERWFAFREQRYIEWVKDQLCES